MKGKGGVKKFLTLFWRGAKETVRTFLDNHCSMHAAGLTYYSMLALVPVLCITLLCAKMFGAGDFAREKIHAKIEQAIKDIETAPAEVAAPIPVPAPSPEAIAEKKRIAGEFAAQAREIEAQVFDAIDKVDMGSLGWIGFLALLWTVLSSIGMVEVSFDEIWEAGKPRPFFKRQGVNALVLAMLPVFAALALTGPVLKVVKDVICATAGSVSAAKWFSDGLVALLDSWPIRIAISLFFSSIAFAFLYSVLPNAKTRWRPAWRCGLATAVLFGGWLKLCAVAQVGIAKTSALYGSLAFLPIMLAWMYMSWQIVLLGCCIHKTVEKGAWSDPPPSP